MDRGAGGPAARGPAEEVETVQQERILQRPPPGAPPSPARVRRGPANWSIPDETLKDRVARKLQDKFQRLYVTQQAIREAGGRVDIELDPHAAEERMHGRIEWDFKQLENDYIEPLADQLAAAQIPLEDLDRYLYAKHAPERNRHIASIRDDMPDAGSGIATADAQRTVRDLEAQYGAAIQQAAQRVYDMLEHKRGILRRQGLEKDDVVDTWENKYRFYVPLKGFAVDAIDDQYPRIGQGLSIKGKESRRSAGRRSLAASPSMQAITDTTESIIRARKNEVGQHFIRLVRANPNPDVWEIFSEDKPDVEVKPPTKTIPHTYEAPVAMHMSPKYFGVKYRGTQYYVKLKDQRLASAMQNLGVEKQNVIIQTMGAVNRFLSSVNTSLNPEFVISNFSRDIQTAIYNVLAEQNLKDSKIAGEAIGKRMVRDTIPAIGAVYRALRGAQGTKAIDRYARDFIEDGAKTGYFDMKDLEAMQRHVETLIEIAEGGMRGRTIKATRAVGQFVEDVNGAIENGVRLSAYTNARKALEARGVNPQAARKRAASISKNLTVNFNRRGEWSSAMNAFYMFFNASVQGTAQFARTMLTMRKVGGKRRLNTAQKVAAAAVGLAYMYAILQRALSDDDDDGISYYDKIPAHIKERNFIFMKGDGKNYWKVPLPYGYNIFHVLGTTVSDTVHGPKKVTEGALDITMAILGSFNPIGMSESNDPGTTAVKTIAPSVLTPAVEIATNENFFGSPVWREDKFKEWTPDSSLSWYTTRPHFVALAQWLNEATGGSEYIKGWIDVSPDSLEHYFDFATGGAGMFVSKVAGVAEKMKEGIPLKVNEIPFYRKISGEPSPYEAGQVYYERRSLALAHLDAWKNLKGDEKAKYKQDHQALITMANRSKAKDKRLRILRKQRDEIRVDETISEKERQAKLEAKQLQMNEVFNDWNGRWNALVEQY